MSRGADAAWIHILGLSGPRTSQLLGCSEEFRTVQDSYPSISTAPVYLIVTPVAPRTLQ